MTTRHVEKKDVVVRILALYFRFLVLTACQNRLTIVACEMT